MRIRAGTAAGKLLGVGACGLALALLVPTAATAAPTARATVLDGPAASCGTAQPGDRVETVADGFSPGATVTVDYRSTADAVADVVPPVTADTSGHVDVVANVPDGAADADRAVIELTGATASGNAAAQGGFAVRRDGTCAGGTDVGDPTVASRSAAAPTSGAAPSSGAARTTGAAASGTATSGTGPTGPTSGAPGEPSSPRTAAPGTSTAPGLSGTPAPSGASDPPTAPPDRPATAPTSAPLVVARPAAAPRHRSTPVGAAALAYGADALVVVAVVLRVRAGR